VRQSFQLRQNNYAHGGYLSMCPASERTAVMLSRWNVHQAEVLPGGKIIQPAGKSYHPPMAKLGHLNKQRAVDTRYLFWDNELLMTQI
jgi:hypothetical protein